MKKIRFNKYCQNKYTEVFYNNGDVVEFEDNRADEIVNSGHADYVVNVLEHSKGLQEETNEENTENTENKDIEEILDAPLPDEEDKDVEEDIEEDIEEDKDVEENSEMINLKELSKPELVKIAKENNVAIRGTRDDIIARLMALAD